jgi:hypothetical protein
MLMNVLRKSLHEMVIPEYVGRVRAIAVTRQPVGCKATSLEDAGQASR